MCRKDLRFSFYFSETVTTGVTHHFGVDSIEERDEWIEIIKQSSVS